MHFGQKSQLISSETEMDEIAKILFLTFSNRMSVFRFASTPFHWAWMRRALHNVCESKSCALKVVALCQLVRNQTNYLFLFGSSFNHIRRWLPVSFVEYLPSNFVFLFFHWLPFIHWMHLCIFTHHTYTDTYAHARARTHPKMSFWPTFNTIRCIPLQLQDDVMQDMRISCNRRSQANFWRHSESLSVIRYHTIATSATESKRNVFSLQSRLITR